MNNTETFIAKFYRSVDISEPYQLSIELIADRLNMQVMYWEHSSVIAFRLNQYKIFINENISSQKKWQDFGHEMSHYFFDETNYSLLNETYAEYGESKADYFAYHFCVPTFMLQDIKGVDVYSVMSLFNVEFDFALRRLEMYSNKLFYKNVSI